MRVAHHHNISFRQVRRVRVRRLSAPKWLLLLPVELAALGLVLFGAWHLARSVWNTPNGDVAEYFRYAHTFWFGSTGVLPFRSFPREYPPLALLPFSLTLWPRLASHQATFAIWAGVIIAIGYVGFLRFAGRKQAILFVMYLMLGSVAIVLGRFDIVPALLTVAALWATERRRFTLAYLLLALGVLLKLYPIFLVPVVVVEQWRAAEQLGTAYTVRARRLAVWVRRRRWALVWRNVRRHPAVRAVGLGTAVCGSIVAVGFGLAMLANPNGALKEFGFASARPVQVESLDASVMWLLTHVGIPAHSTYAFSSLDYIGPLSGLLASLSMAAMVAGCLLVYWLQMRGQLAPRRAFLACISILIVTNKVFSPQYIIWVVPFVALVEGFDLLWVAICAITVYDFPVMYLMRGNILAVPLVPQFMPLLAVRNFLLLYVTARLLLRSSSGGPTRVQAPAPHGAGWEDGHAFEGGREDTEPAPVG